MTEPPTDRRPCANPTPTSIRRSWRTHPRATVALRSQTSAGTFAEPGADDCAHVQPIPEISGATWLIIEGADWATIEAENPGVTWESTDVMTWVYLDEAS